MLKNEEDPTTEEEEKEEEDNEEEEEVEGEEGEEEEEEEEEEKEKHDDSGFIHVPPSIMNEIENPAEEISRLRDEVKKRDEQLESNENRIATLTKERDMLKSTVNMLENEKAIVFKNYEESKTEVSNKDKLIEEQKEDLAKSQEEIRLLLVDLEKARNESPQVSNDDHEKMAVIVQREKQLEEEQQALQKAKEELEKREAALSKKMSSMTVVIGGVQYEAQLQVSSPEAESQVVVVEETKPVVEKKERVERTPPTNHRTPSNALVNQRVIEESPLTKNSPKVDNVVDVSPIPPTRTAPPTHVEVHRVQKDGVAPATPEMNTPDITSLVPMTPPLSIPSSPMGEDPQAARRRKRRRKQEVARKALTKILGIEEPTELQKIVRAGGITKIAKIASIYASKSPELMDTLLRVLDRFANDSYCSVEVSKNDLLVNLVAKTINEGTPQQKNIASSIKERLVM